MRKIKFRVWDELDGKYDPLTYDAGEQFGHPASCDWVAEQCTEVKDCKGQLIYEGDIIACFRDWWGTNHKNGVVSYCSKQGKYIIHNKNHLGGLDHVRPRNFKVIGNIHENPEL